jgi:hypothetical protein
MSCFNDFEKTVDAFIASPAPDVVKIEHEARRGEDSEISSRTTNDDNDRLMRLNNEHGVCKSSNTDQFG